MANSPTSLGMVFQAHCESINQLQAAAGSWRRARTRGGMCDPRKHSICEWHAWSIDEPLYAAIQFLSILGALQQPLVEGQRTLKQVLVGYKPGRSADTFSSILSQASKVLFVTQYSL